MQQYFLKNVYCKRQYKKLVYIEKCVAHEQNTGQDAARHSSCYDKKHPIYVANNG